MVVWWQVGNCCQCLSIVYPMSVSCLSSSSLSLQSDGSNPLCSWSVAEEYQVWRTRPCGNGGTRLQDSFRLCICHYQSVDLPFSCILGESTQIHMELVFRHLFITSSIGCGCSRLGAPVITTWTTTSLRFLLPCHIPLLIQLEQESESCISPKSSSWPPGVGGVLNSNRSISSCLFCGCLIETVTGQVKSRLVCARIEPWSNSKVLLSFVSTFAPQFVQVPGNNSADLQFTRAGSFGQCFGFLNWFKTWS